MNIRHLWRSLMPFTERMAAPQNASLLYQRNCITSCSHFTLPCQCSSVARTERFFPEQAGFSSQYLENFVLSIIEKPLQANTSVKYVYLVLHFSLLYTAENLKDHVTHVWFNYYLGNWVWQVTWLLAGWKFSISNMQMNAQKPCFLISTFDPLLSFRV